MRRVAAIAVFVAVVTATTAFVRDDSAPAGVDPGGLQLTSRADVLSAAPPVIDPPADRPMIAEPLATSPEVEDQQFETEVARLAPPVSQPTPSPVTRPQAPPDTVDQTAFGQPAWQRYALAAPPRDGRPLIAIVIDDLGVNQRRAQHRGHAIGLGHPHETTLGAMRDWLKTLEERGFRLAPLSTVVARNYDLG